MATYLVTGAAGFIGSHLCDRLLAEGKRVVGVDDLSRGRIANLVEARSYGGQFTFYTMDVRAEGLRTLLERHQPEVVLHLAAQPSVRTSLTDPILDASVNIMGLLNLMEGASRAGVRKVVFASSGGAIYGEQRKIPVKETARKGSRPTSPYGVSKKVAEDFLAFYARYRRVDYTVLALANVYGPRQDPGAEAGVVAIFAGKMLAGEAPMIFGDGNQTRDYVFVDDAMHAFALATERGSGLLLNVGTGLEASVNLVYRLLAEAAGFGGAPSRGPLPPGELIRSALDVDLAAAELGWRPWTHLEDGLRETVAYLRETLERA
ncbi:MAG TPA: NAD-dependent epimerase/dehydratase family protein [Actinomycetota bacterium]